MSALDTSHPGLVRPTVVALHCSASSPRQWAPYAAALCGRATLVAPALLGYDDAMGAAAQDRVDLEAEAERLWLQLMPRREAVHLVGHSYGAAVALAMARWWPQRVLSLTLYEPIPFAQLRRDDDAGPWREIHALACEVALWVRLGQPERAAERFIDYWGGSSSWAAMPPYRREAVVRRMPKVCQEFDALFDDPTARGAWSLLTMPVRVLCGSQSPAPALRTSEHVARLLPQTEFRRLPGLGHMGPVDRPDVVLPHLPLAVERRAEHAAFVSAA